MIAFIIAVALFVSIDTEKQWFNSVGYGKVFTTQIWIRILLFLGFGLFMAGATFGNVYLAYRLRPSFRASRDHRVRLGRPSIP